MANDVRLNITMNEKAAIRGLVSLSKQSKKTGRTAKRSFGRMDAALGSFIGNITSRALSRGVQLMGQGFRAMARSMNEFSKGSAEINTILPKTGQLTDQAKNILAEFNSEFGTDSTEQMKGFYQAVSAGVEGTVNQLDVLRQANVLAAAGLVDVGTATKSVTSIMNAYAKQGVTATEVTDKLFLAVQRGQTTIGDMADKMGRVTPLAASAGASLSEVTGSIAVLTKRGLQTEEVITGLRSLFKGIVKPTVDSKKAAEELGIQLNSTALKTKGLVGFMKDLTEATGGNTKQLARLFPNVRALVPVLSIVTGDFADFNKIMTEAESSSGVAAGAFDRMKKSMAFQFSALGSQLDTFAGKMTTILEPAIAGVTGELNVMILEGMKMGAIADLISSIRGPLVTIFTVIKSVGDMFQLLFSIVKFTVIGISNAINQFLIVPIMKVVDAISQAVASVPVFGSAIDRLSSGSLASFGKSVDGLKESFKEMGDTSSIIAVNDAFKRMENSARMAGNETETLRERIQNLREKTGTNGETEGDGGEEDGGGQTETESATNQLDILGKKVMSVNEMIVGSFDKTTSEGKKFAKEAAKFSQSVSSALQSGIATGAANAFSAMGGAMAEGENMLSAFLGSFLSTMGQMAVELGQMYIKQGVARMLAGIPGGGALIAAGAALATFGGVMGASFGGGAPSASTGGGGGGGAPAPMTGIEDEEEFEEEDIEPEPKTQVNVTVEGNIMDSEESGSRIVEMINDAFGKEGVVVRNS